MEAQIQELARKLLSASRQREPITLSPDWWQTRLLDWAGSDSAFRTKLLRFVDVLPALRTSSAVADHIRQYFREGVPTLVEAGSLLATPAPFRPVVSRVVREGVFAMAGRFIAGESPVLALPRLRELASAGVGYTVDLLGEATLSEAEAAVYEERYQELLRTLAAEGPGPSGPLWHDVPPLNVSVKLSALTSHFEPAAPDHVSQAVRRRLTPILEEGRRLNAFVNVDMEQHQFRDLTLDVFEDTAMLPAFRDYPHLGVVVQAYLRTAEDAIHRLRELAQHRGVPVTVRLVKGAYWDEERICADQYGWPVPVFEDKAETDACFERCTDLLLDAWPHLRVAFGSHHPRSVAQAIVKARERGRESDIEFQMLYGMAETLRNAVAEAGFRTRVYVPVGAIIPGMAYLVRRLLENTSNQSWFARESLDASEQELVSPPRPAAGEEPRKLAPRFINTPLARFHEPSQRAGMNDALKLVRGQFGRTQPPVLAGRQVRDRKTEEACSPADPAMLLGRVGQASTEDVDVAVATSTAAFPAWRDLGVSRRALVLREAANRMEQHRFELAALMVYESAKPWREADGDVAEACDYLRYYAGQAERLMEPQQLGLVLGEENLYVREPRGVAAIIAPWNFPLAIITGMTAAALAAGNCAIVKPAEQSPFIAARMVEILHTAGVPGEVLHYLPGPGEEVGRSLVEHPGVAIIAFTGSKEVGLQILRTASEVRPGQKQMKRVIAEMGGKNAIIIDEDADLDQAVAGVVKSAFGYAGQKCSACSRLIVIGSAYSEVESRLAAAVESLRVGPPEDPATVVPPVISMQARRRIETYIEAGKQTARLLIQGRAPNGPGHYVAPTVFADVRPEDRLAQDEIFGPVLSVFHVENIEQALALALNSEFALTGGIYSRNPRNLARARDSFRVGNLYVNRAITGAVVGRQAFGGLAMSGIGDKAGGPDYLLQFLNPRTITENQVRRGFAPS